MARIELEDQTVESEVGEALIDVLERSRVNVKKICGGRGLCATCHVYVSGNPKGLSPPTDRERMTLSILTGAREDSRLACQCKVQEDGVKLAFPDGLYVESFQDLEAQVGKRTKSPILHPSTGQVLVEANKIIMRTQIMKLKDMDFSILKDEGEN